MYSGVLVGLMKRVASFRANGMIATSQLALTEEASKVVYASSGYEQSLRNLSKVNLDTDMVFRDGYDLQMPTITGDPSKGYTLDFTCAV